MNRYILLDSDNKIVSVRYGSNIVENEVESDTGEIGQIMQSDGTFITPEPTPVDPQPTLEDKINYIYYKQMGVIS